MARAPKARTQWQAVRDKLLADKELSKADVHAALVERLRKKAPKIASVRAVLDGRYRNAAIEAVFCSMTGADPAVAFPLDEPPYGRAPERRNMTARRRQALAHSTQEPTDG